MTPIEQSSLPRPSPSIRNRFLLTVAIVAPLLLGVLLGGPIVVRSLLDRVESDGVARRVKRARLHFAEQTELKRTEAMEYASGPLNWSFLERPDDPVAARRAREHLLERVPARSGDEAIGLWNRQRRPLLQWADSGTSGDLGVVDDALFSRLDREGALGGYAWTPAGLMIVGGAVVTPEPGHRDGAPYNGYLVVVEPVASKLLDHLSFELQNGLAIAPRGGSAPGGTPRTRKSKAGDSLYAAFEIPSLRGDVAAVAELGVSRVLVTRLIYVGDLVFIIAALAGGVGLVVAWQAIQRLLLRPIRQVAATLQEMERSGRLTLLEAAAPYHEWEAVSSVFNSAVEALRRTERARQAADQRAAAVVEASPAAIIGLDLEGRVTVWSPGAQRMFGFEATEVMGKPLPVVPPETAGTQAEMIYFLRQGRAPVTQQTLALRRNGNRLHVHVSAAPIRGNDAAPIGWVAIYTDMSELVRGNAERESLELQLRQMQKMEAIGSLAGGIAHDFNNLMAAVLMAASQLRWEMRDTPAAGQAVDTIERVSRRAVELTRGLLRVVRGGPREHRPFSVADTLDHLQRLCARTFGQGIRVELRMTPDLPLLKGDQGGIEQALLNLCINARDAMPQGGVLRLEAELRVLDAAAAAKIPQAAPGGYVVLTVSDTGLGMAPEVRARMFEPFFTTKAQGQGTGLGLSIVSGVVDAHGGAITMDTGPGEGTSISLFLPVEPGPGPTTADTLQPAAPRGSETILVVDDEGDLRTLVRRALEGFGYRVLTAENGRAGVAMLEEHADEVDLVLLDVMMPDMGGAEALRRMRALRPTLRVLVISGHQDGTSRREIGECGLEGFLGKPFVMDELAAAVREALDREQPVSGAGVLPRSQAW